MSCVLSIIGENLDIDAFIAESGLQPHKKTYKGEPRFKTKPDGEEIPYSFLSIIVSDAEFDDFKKQVADVVEFLEANKTKLEYISAVKEVKYAVLDFGVDSTTRSHFLPKSLLKLVSTLGLEIEISVYNNEAFE